MSHTVKIVKYEDSKVVDTWEDITICHDMPRYATICHDMPRYATIIANQSKDVVYKTEKNKLAYKCIQYSHISHSCHSIVLY